MKLEGRYSGSTRQVMCCSEAKQTNSLNMTAGVISPTERHRRRSVEGINMSTLPTREVGTRSMKAWKKINERSIFGGRKINMSMIPLVTTTENEYLRRLSVDSSVSASTACSKEGGDDLSIPESYSTPTRASPLSGSFATAQASSPTRSDFCSTFKTAICSNTSQEDFRTPTIDDDASVSNSLLQVSHRPVFSTKDINKRDTASTSSLTSSQGFVNDDTELLRVTSIESSVPPSPPGSGCGSELHLPECDADLGIKSPISSAASIQHVDVDVDDNDDDDDDASLEINSTIEAGSESDNEMDCSTRLNVDLCPLSPQNKISHTSFDPSRFKRTPVVPDTLLAAVKECEFDQESVEGHFLHDDSLFPKDEAWGSMAGQTLLPSIKIITACGESFVELEAGPYLEFGVPFKAKKYYDDADSDSSSGMEEIVEVPLSDCSSSSDDHSLPCYDIDFDSLEECASSKLAQQDFELSNVYSACNTFPHLSHDTHTFYNDNTFKPSCMFPTSKRLGSVLVNEYFCNKSTNKLIKVNASVIDVCDVQTDDEVYFDMKGKTHVPSRFIYGDNQFSIYPNIVEKYCQGAKAHMEVEHPQACENTVARIQKLVEYCSAKKRRGYMSFFCETRIKDLGDSETIATLLSQTKASIEETEELLQEAMLARSKTRGNESAASRSAKLCHTYSSQLENLEERKSNLVRKAHRAVDSEIRSLIETLDLPDWVLNGTFKCLSKYIALSIPVASLVSGATDSMGRLQPHVDNVFKALFCTINVGGGVIASSVTGGILCVSKDYYEDVNDIKKLVSPSLPQLCCLYLEIDDDISDEVDAWVDEESLEGKVVTHKANSKALACELAINKKDVTLLVPSAVASVAFRRVGHGWQTARGDDFGMEHSVMATTTACVAPSLSPLFR
eukprot:TRINITY_DN1708_c0_g1_i1.p1 TRINITY_DN1708_c0_g1~~TRINITY_DN1708_c0_g1_i1.p1  ORF type:complete len:916 (+),score=193.19 TRINITY_DN1708_c0_g1_i1:47-2749(+)